MTDKQFTNLYPDVEQVGSLAKLLRAELPVIGSELNVCGFDQSIGGSRYWARVSHGVQGTDVKVAMHDRCFMAALWRCGVRFGSVATLDSAELVRLLDAWFVDEVSSEQLASMSDAVSIDADVPFYEAGPEEFVRYRWVQLSDSNDFPRLQPLIDVASQSVLNRLLPYTSMDTLCFSRCTGYPFLDVGRISPIHAKVDRFSVVCARGEKLFSSGRLGQQYD
jgi:hypothetical protein